MRTQPITLVITGILATVVPTFGALVDSPEEAISASSAATSTEIRLAGRSAEDAARRMKADELVAELTLPSGTKVTVGASVLERESADELAKEALAELAGSMTKSDTNPSKASLMSSDGAIDDAARRNSDVSALNAIVNSDTQIYFTEARDNSALKSARETSLLAESRASAPSAAAAVSGKWWPEVVQAQSYENSNGRVGKLAFYWSAAAKNVLVAHSSRATFEPDFVTYNYDGKHYFDTSIKSWSTTMPAGYKDSKDFDSTNELVYTIGTSDANAIKSGVTYQTVFITGKGNASSDKAKVVAQLGTHLPGCTNPKTCIFADASRKYFDGWKMTIPKGTWQSSS